MDREQRVWSLESSDSGRCWWESPSVKKVSLIVKFVVDLKSNLSETMAHAAPPTDVELAIRIEKLADYVARNGAKFEQITRQNQQGNPEFQFLEEGNINNKYYRHVLNCLLNGGWTLDQIIQVRNSQPLLQTNTVKNLIICI